MVRTSALVGFGLLLTVGCDGGNGSSFVGADSGGPRVPTLPADSGVSPDASTPAPVAGTVAKRIGALGGVIAADDGSWRLDIPPGALDAETEIRVTAPSSPVGTAPEEFVGVGDALHFAPSGLQFAEPATLTLSYSQGAMRESGAEERMVGFYYIHDDSSVEEAPSELGMEANQVVVVLEPFSFGRRCSRSCDRTAEDITLGSGLHGRVRHRPLRA